MMNTLPTTDGQGAIREIGISEGCDVGILLLYPFGIEMLSICQFQLV